MDSSQANESATGTPANRPPAGSAQYGFFRRVEMKFDDAVNATKEALKGQGFGVLAEIDVQKTLQGKLGISYPPYLILGACNPKLAHQALENEAELGLLLPCNVIVRETSDGIEIGVIDAEKMMAFVQNPALDEVARQASEKLRTALASIS